MKTKTMMSLALLGLLLGLHACATGGTKKTTVDDTEPGPPEHWIQDARLRAIMRDLERETIVSWPQEIQDRYPPATKSQQAVKALEEACWLADGLAKAAGRIPAAVAHIDMSEADRRGFLAQVETLRDQAQKLEEVAGQADLDGMRQVLSHIRQTCNACHERFRDFAGPMD